MTMYRPCEPAKPCRFRTRTVNQTPFLPTKLGNPLTQEVMNCFTLLAMTVLIHINKEWSL